MTFTEAQKAMIGRVARRIGVAISGALGLTATQLPVAEALITAAAAIIISLICEYYSSKHDSKLVGQAVDFALNDPGATDAMLAGRQPIDEMSPNELKKAVADASEPDLDNPTPPEP